MRDNDQQLGKPMRVYRDTRLNIEGLGLGAGDEGCEAYATDHGKYGKFGGDLWAWDELYNVRAFGATGAGQPTNDYAAILATINAASAAGGGTVYFPPPANKYFVSRGGDNHIFNWPIGVNFLAHGPNQTVIEAKENRAIFRIDPAGNNQFFFMKGLYLTYDGYQGANAHCLMFNAEGPGQDNNFILENLILANGHTGYYQTGNQWGGLFRNMLAYECRNGFNIDTNVFTTHKFDSCGAHGTADTRIDLAGWYMENGRNIVLDSCWMENYTGTVGQLAQWDKCEGLTISGFHLERNANLAGVKNIMFLANCRGYSLNGIRSAGNLLRVGTHPAYCYFLVDYCDVRGSGSSSGVFAGGDAGDYVYGSGTIYMMAWHGNVNSAGQGLDITNPTTVAELDYDAGAVEFAAGERIKGAISGANGYEVFHEISAGSWGGGNAAGKIYLRDVVGGPFQNNEDLVNFTTLAYRATADGVESQPAQANKWSLFKSAAGGNVVISGSRYDTWLDPNDQMCDITGPDGCTKLGAE